MGNCHQKPFLVVFCVFRPFLDLNISKSPISTGKIFGKLINTYQCSKKNANAPSLREMGGSYGTKTRKNGQKCRLPQLWRSISGERWHFRLSSFHRVRAKNQSYSTMYNSSTYPFALKQSPRSLPFLLIKDLPSRS